jgi:hypothetical protein
MAVFYCSIDRLYGILALIFGLKYTFAYGISLVEYMFYLDCEFLSYSNTDRAPFLIVLKLPLLVLKTLLKSVSRYEITSLMI